MKKSVLLLSLLLSARLFSAGIPGLTQGTVTQRKTIDYTAYDAFLRNVVNGRGEVNYHRVVADRQTLQAIVQEFLNSNPAALQSKEEKLAFYINTYNAVTLYQVSWHYPVQSVLHNFPGGEFFKNTFPMAGKKITLDQLENEIIRPQFKNPYIHFALNCASVSCPILEKNAWRAAGLQKRMRAAAHRYLTNANFARYDAASKTLWLSELFKWYADDFGNPVIFYNNVTEKKIPLDVKIAYLPYNWDLNKKIP